jgi:hypothetical protein
MDESGQHAANGGFSRLAWIDSDGAADSAHEQACSFVLPGRMTPVSDNLRFWRRNLPEVLRADGP